MNRRDDMQYLHDLMAKMDSRLDDISETLIKQQSSIDYHIKRTDLIEDELKPIVKSMYMIKGILWLLSIAATIAAIYEAIK